MPYPRHVLLQFGGPLHTTEQWSTSLRLVPDAVTTDGEIESSIEAGLTDVLADLTSFIASARFSSAVELAYVKMNRIGPDGRYARQDITHARYISGTLPKGTATPAFPPQVTLVATLHTAAARGPASKGRIFLPSPVGALQTDGRLAATTATLYRDHVTTLITAINNWPGIDAFSAGLDVSVVSDIGEGTERKVTGVSVGRVLDTQRRRRGNLLEERTAPSVIS